MKREKLELPMCYKYTIICIISVCKIFILCIDLVSNLRANVLRASKIAQEKLVLVICPAGVCMPSLA